MNWNICNFHFFPNVSFPLIYLFIYLFVWQWEHFLQLLVCSHEPQAAVLGTHMLRRSRLPTTAFIVLQQLLWRSSGCAGFNCICLPGSINPSCNFIGIFSHHPLSSITPPRAYTSSFISMRSEDDCLKTLFTVQIVEIHRGSVTWWHPMDSG